MGTPTDHLVKELETIARKIAAQPDIPKGVIDKDVVSEVTEVARELDDIVDRLKKLKKAAHKAWGDAEDAMEAGLDRFIAENIGRDPEYADREIASDDWSETDEYGILWAAQDWCESLYRSLEGVDGYAFKIESIQDHLDGFAKQIK